MTIEKLKTLKGLDKTPEKALDDPFMILLEKIKTIRQDSKALKGLVNDAMRLALKDSFIHNNDNSLKALVMTPIDYTKRGFKVYLYACYNVRPYLDSLGIKLDSDGKGGFSIFFKKGFNLSFKDIESFDKWYDSNAIKDFKKPIKEKPLKVLTIDDLKGALKAGQLSIDDLKSLL